MRDLGSLSVPQWKRRNRPSFRPSNSAAKRGSMATLYDWAGDRGIAVANRRVFLASLWESSGRGRRRTLPFERQIVHVPLHARIAKEMPKICPHPGNCGQSDRGSTNLSSELCVLPWIEQPKFHGGFAYVSARTAIVAGARLQQRCGRQRRSAGRNLLEGRERNSPVGNAVVRPGAVFDADVAGKTYCWRMPIRRCRSRRWTFWPSR